MASRYVSDTAAGKSISAWIVLNAAGAHVATVRAFYGQSVLVNVFNHGDAASMRCAEARELDGTTIATAYKVFGFQHGRAGGYGYDKFTAALSGLIIDGHEMTNHCGASHPLLESAKVFPLDYKAPPGYALANFSREQGVWLDCYRLPGLKYLEAIGYRVIQAI